ncbi:TPA: hypothetical protein N2D04_002518 [Clostridium botulinum]|uniref:hypothetical protein n=1 Tax=Clostridium botulinum TaxID=1491 RepID=UPI000B1F57B9|nr:hypothetical protein [Clostridium botulinum]MCC5416482.1 hypothetical protein [Clostridium botulinum]MCC5425860.1 hypothetical protein [Clostridium botulinum]HCL4447457.1 hypothetical protein [Clostridium botulinum]HCL4458404.1 hypothetical protein [Clostridium botulinum]HCL4462316.1 hypothetical protein [Clostridium botulinum]
MLDYRIITKEEYKKIRLNSVSASSICEGMIKEIDKNWDSLRKGYDFVIAAGIEGDGMLYSVEYFNGHVLNGKDNSKTLTLKLKLDTTEFENKLNKTEEQLIRIKNLKDMLGFDKALNEVKNITINNSIDMKDMIEKVKNAVEL